MRIYRHRHRHFHSKATRHHRRHHHHFYRTKFRTRRIILEVSIILLVVSLGAHFLGYDPCGQSNPATWISAIYSPADYAARCVASRRQLLAASSSQPANFLPLALRVPEDSQDYQHLLSKYQAFIPKNRRVTLQYLRSLPNDVKALCDANCKTMVKEYLRTHGGNVELRSVPVTPQSR